MPPPWERYAQQQPQPRQAGPWEQYPQPQQMQANPRAQAMVRSGELPALPGEQGPGPFVGPPILPPTLGQQAKRQAGLAVRGVAQAATDLPYMPFDALATGYNVAQRAINPQGYDVTIGGQRVRRSGQIPTATEQREQALSAVGLPTPISPSENIGNTMLRSSLGAGGSAKLVGAFGAGPVAQAFAAEPGLQLASGATGGASAGLAREMGAGPVGQIAAGFAGGMVPYLIPRNTPPLRSAPPTAEDVLARSADDGGSVGASAAATNVSDASDDLRRAIVETGGKRGRINNEVLNRHLEADTLPVPVRLTAGEATQDPVALSLERNLRGKHPEMVERMAETNRALGQNMQAIRDQVGPEVFSTNPVEHGDTLIGAYRALDSSAERAVNRAYHNLRQAAGGDVPVDAQAVLNDATARLHKRLLYDHAPAQEMAQLTRLAQSNSMTFENFESMRTNLARIARSNADGNVKAAAGEIRAALEQLPLRAGAEHLKTIADNARALARRRFQAMEADPAYAAAVNGTVPPDRFVQKFVIGGTRDDLDLMLRTLGNNPSVRQTVSVAALDHLRDAARLNPAYEGNFSSAGFSRALQGLSAKANIIFDPRTAENIGKLNNVARYTTAQPRGSFVNNSNTMVASLANNAGKAVEGVINYSTMGLGAPVGAAARNYVEKAPSRALIRNALQPGAGLDAPKNALVLPPKR